MRASGNGDRVDRYNKGDIIVSPSILSADFAKLGEQVRSEALAACLQRPASGSSASVLARNCSLHDLPAHQKGQQPEQVLVSW